MNTLDETDDISAKAHALTAAVIGHPIAHSRSPMIHNRWLAEEGLAGQYGVIDILPAALPAACDILRQSPMTGFNATLPHKEMLLDLCDEVDATARAIGAVNTVSVRDGRLYGTNTDAFGFMENLRQGAPEFDPAGKTALVLGAGGAARAVLFGLQAAGIGQILLLNRTRSKAEALAEAFPGVQVAEWAARQALLKDVQLLVNTTSLGMCGQPDLELDLGGVSPEALVTDLVYNPLQTSLLNHAAAKGCQTVTGLGMLVYQAQKAFEIWFGVRPAVTDELIKTLEDSL
ncbi:MAG: shikimate dehydrogenase [Rhodospirillales bacterium]|nr:shikimate dehydrogenase [Rhodospirillales bacterium]